MSRPPFVKPGPVVGQGEFIYGAVGLEHGHIYGMCQALNEAGASLRWVYDRDPAKVEQFRSRFPEAKAARSEDEVSNDPAVRLVAGAAVPSERCALGLRVMDVGKDYFTDKTPFTTLEQVEAARAKVAATGRKYAVYYSERIHVPSAVYAGDLVKAGVIGRVVQVLGTGPHRLNIQSRPPWFFELEKYGGILCDIGSHQIEQFLFYTGAQDAEVQFSRVANYNYKAYPEFQDFGDAMLVGDNGATNYFRIDWFTPDGLGTWGDGRLILLGTEGYIELRKYIDVARDRTSDHLYLVTRDGEEHLELQDKVGCPYFGRLILDCLNRTEDAMGQEHAFKAGELCVRAQMQAVKIE